MLLLASCGQQHDAEQLVKEFMKENMKDASLVSSVDFDKMDSTRLINDSIITRMRAMTNMSDRYKTDIKYHDVKTNKKLFILRARYNVNEEEWCDTYYLDADLTRVVALKAN